VRVVALIADRDAAARITDALRGHAELTCCDTAAELMALLQRDCVSAAIVEVRDASGTPMDSAIAALRAGYPSLPVVAYCPLATATPHDILLAAKAGASGLVLRGVDDEGVALRTALTSASDDCAARRVLAELEVILPPVVRPIMEYCVLHARSAPTVEEMARALGMNRKTLVNRLALVGMPPPKATIGWARLLLAAQLLAETRRTVEVIAHELDFPSGPALRNMLKRYTRLQPRQVRERDGLARVLEAFRRALSGPARERRRKAED
jgi:AraC-like DNA-binding protein